MVTLLLSVLAMAGPHADQMLEYGAGAPHPPAGARRATTPPATPGPDMTVYGYQAYWDDDLFTVPWNDLSHIALFAAEAGSDGTLTNTSRWDEATTAVALAAPYGVRVHLCVINFDTASLRILLGDPTARDRLVASLATWQRDTGAHGINIDFEGVPSDRRDELVAFTEELAAEVGEVVLASPAVDWSGAWDYSELTRHADLFIMGYGYHWGGSSVAGPTDPLYAGTGTPFTSRSLSGSVDDYLAMGADPDRVILGLPLYGLQWPTIDDAVPSSTTGGGSSIFWAEGNAGAAVHGRRWEPTSLSPWYWDGAEQTWYPDEASLEARITYVREETPIAGIGFWALHYDDDDPDLWEMIAAGTTWKTSGGTDTGSDPTTSDTGSDPTTWDTGSDPTTSDPTTSDTTDTGTTDTGGADTLPWVADAGEPFLAYIGDTVQLSGKGSTIPAGSVVWSWNQVAGPAVSLTGDTTSAPTFSPDTSGTHVFELRVGNEVGLSSPDRSYVLVLDPDAGRRHDGAGCGCATGGSPSWWGLLLLLGYRRACHARLRREDRDSLP